MDAQGNYQRLSKPPGILISPIFNYSDVTSLYDSHAKQTSFENLIFGDLTGTLSFNKVQSKQMNFAHLSSNIELQSANDKPTSKVKQSAVSTTCKSDEIDLSVIKKTQQLLQGLQRLTAVLKEHSPEVQQAKEIAGKVLKQQEQKGKGKDRVEGEEIDSGEFSATHSKKQDQLDTLDLGNPSSSPIDQLIHDRIMFGSLNLEVPPLYTYEPTYETAHHTQQTALRRMEALDLEVGFGNKLLIGSGRAFVKTGQGIKQLGLAMGEKLGIITEGTTAHYTAQVNSETSLYYQTPVGQSRVAKSGEILTDIAMCLAIPEGAGSTGARFVAQSAMAGAILSGLQPTEEGSLSSRAENAAIGAAEAAVGGYVFSKTAKGLHWAWEKSQVKFNLGAGAGAKGVADLSKKSAKTLDALDLAGSSSGSYSEFGAGLVTKRGARNNFRISKDLKVSSTNNSTSLDSTLNQNAPLVTQKGLDRIEAHLDQVLLHQRLPKELQIGERTMLERLRSGNRSSQDIEFYLHELKESSIFRQTGELSSAHKNALQWRSTTERDLFHQNVIDANKEIFPIKWRENDEFNAHPPKPSI